jgi:arylsulfatase A-like enzyme
MRPLSIVTALGLALTSAAPARQPNLVVMLADDAGWGDYSQNGNTMVRTPNIDSIAKNGSTLDRFFVCPVCSPTRAEFLTGRYYGRTGVRGVSTGQERLNLDEKTIADSLKAANYATGAFGKWHNGSQWPYHPMARGFDEYYGHTSGHWGEYFDPPLEHNGKPVREQGYIVDLCTNKALDFIDRNKERPFFCYLPFTTPHSPWGVPADKWQQWKDRPLTQTATLAAQEVADETRCALAMVENQDDNVGRVLDRLRKYDLLDDTIIVYFSDNGPNTSRWTGGMKGKKGTVDEGGVRSLCFIQWPGKIPAGQMVTGIAGATDLLPTLTAMLGVQHMGAKPLDGKDRSPFLLGKSTEWPLRSIYSNWGGSRSLRTQTHRLDAQDQLFDMVADPGQTRPINVEQPQLVAELAAQAAALTGDIYGAAAASQPTGKSKGKGKPGAGNAVDPRPLPVGYAEFPRTWLPARDATPHGDIRRSSNAPNCSYFVHWTQADDHIDWALDIHATGNYRAEILYTCPDKDIGSTLQLMCQDQVISTKVRAGWDPPLYTNQDTIPRPAGESKMKEFKPLDLGVIKLTKGLATMTLQAKEIPGASVADLRALTLTLVTK